MCYLARHRRLRRGVQILEMVMSLTTASMLVAGIATSVFLASEGREIAIQSQMGTSQTQAGLDQLRQDLAEAKTFYSRSATGATFTVEDRNGDGSDETLQYNWSTGGALMYYDPYAGGISITDNLDHFEMTWRSNAPQESASAVTFDPVGQYVFQSFTNNDGSLLGSTSLNMSLPNTYQSGDLLVAVVAVDGDQAGSITASSPWTKIGEVNKTSDLSLAAFYCFYPSGNVNFSWNSWDHCHAVIAHFSAPGTSGSVDGIVVNQGNSSTPEAPTITANHANSLVFRVLAVEQVVILDDSTNFPGHMPLLYRTRALVGPGLAVAYRNFASSGSIPAGNFHLSESKDFCSATVVIHP